MQVVGVDTVENPLTGKEVKPPWTENLQLKVIGGELVITKLPEGELSQSGSPRAGVAPGLPVPPPGIRKSNLLVKYVRASAEQQRLLSLGIESHREI